MYADDVVIISDNAKGLQNGLDFAQHSVGKSGFEFPLDAGKSEVTATVFGDDRDYRYEWKLMGNYKAVENFT